MTYRFQFHFTACKESSDGLETHPPPHPGFLGTTQVTAKPQTSEVAVSYPKTTTQEKLSLATTCKISL